MEGLYFMLGIAVVTGIAFRIVFNIQDKNRHKKGEGL